MATTTPKRKAGKIMARISKSRAERFEKPPRGVIKLKGTYIDDGYLQAEAFATLNGAETRLLLGFLARRRWDKKKKRFTNLIDIIYTLDCMAYEVNVTKQAALKARQTLIDLGFIDLLDQTDWGNHSNNRYGISDRFKKWHPNPKTRIENGFIEHKPLRKKDATSGTKQKKAAPKLRVMAAAN